jgi:hypothetical protein
VKALLRLQGAIIVQAAQHEDVADRFCQRAKQFVAFGAIGLAAIASGNAQAQQGPLSPSNCAAVGATVGGTVGYATPKNDAARIVGAALGGIAGAAAGNWLCSPKQAMRDSSYDRAAGYGVADGSTAVDRSNPRAALSISERERLDDLSVAAINAKSNWKRALWNVDQARTSGNQVSVTAALESEAEARNAFETKRATFSTTVARLHQGAGGGEPRAVGRYLEISAALLELNTESRVSYQMLQSRDELQQQRSPAYATEVERAASRRNRNG